MQQIQEDLPQEQEDNKHDPEEKKKALKAIIADYNERFGTNHRIDEFDLYYQDVQKRIKDQQFPNADLPKKGREKIDITIVVDMLLTGFDSKYLNTLYVDKNLKHHGLIQAFSPHQPRAQRHQALRPHPRLPQPAGRRRCRHRPLLRRQGRRRPAKSGSSTRPPSSSRSSRTPSPTLDNFMKSQGLEAKPEDVPNLKGDDARAAFIKQFKEVQRLQTQLDQYTDLTPSRRADHRADPAQGRAQRLPRRSTSKPPSGCRNSRTSPAATAKTTSHEVDQLDFEFVLFASAVIDYDYIMRPDRRLLRAGPQASRR